MLIKRRLKKKIGISFVLCLILVLTSCEPVIETPYTTLNFTNEFDSKENLLNIVSYLDDNSLLYYVVNEGTAHFYRMFADESATTVKVGTIEGYYLDAGSVALYDNKVFFYATILDNEVLENQLFSIDLETNDLNQYIFQDGSLYGLRVYVIENQIVTLKNVVNGDVITTYIETFQPDSNKWKIVIKGEYNSNDRTGDAIYGFYADGKYLYTIEDRYNDKLSKSFFVTYDSSFNKIREIELNDDALKFLQNGNGRLIELYINGEYIYLRNISNQGFIGKITSEHIEGVLEENGMIPVIDIYNREEKLYFTRRSNRLYSFKYMTNGWERLKVDGSEIELLQLFSNHENLIVLADGLDTGKMCFLLNRNDLVNYS